MVGCNLCGTGLALEEDAAQFQKNHSACFQSKPDGRPPVPQGNTMRWKIVAAARLRWRAQRAQHLSPHEGPADLIPACGS